MTYKYGDENQTTTCHHCGKVKPCVRLHGQNFKTKKPDTIWVCHEDIKEYRDE